MNVHSSSVTQMARVLYSFLTKLMVAALFLLAGCGSKMSHRPIMEAPEVGVMTLQPGSVAVQSELPGRTVAFKMSDVRPQATGIIKQRLFEEGSTVSTGQVLYVIDASSYQAAYDQSKADLTNAEAVEASSKLKDERYEQLMEMQGVSKQEADDARATHLQALASIALKKAALESARINLGYTQIRAPISGRIGKSSVTVGALVTANQDSALATIRALDPIYVDLMQSSTQLLELRRLLGTDGMKSGSRKVSLKLENGDHYAEYGTLKFQEVAVDQATGSVTLRAQFPNPRGDLLPGMYVRAVLDEAVNSSALLAPQLSISRDPRGNPVVMIAGKDDQVEQREVVISRSVGNDYIISSGLQSGDRLIVEGLNKIRVGQKIRPVTVQSKATNSATAHRPADEPAASQALIGRR
jgi:membrane fusion protein, multidrug efflux system